MRLKLLFLIPAVLSLTLAQNLFTNGDFEQDLSVGWTQTVGGVGTQTMDRNTTYQPDPDYEAMAYQYSGSGWVNLGQVVDVAGPDLLLTFWASFWRGASSSSCWPVACIVADYRDAGGTSLGQTRFYYRDAYCTWTPTATLSLIDVTNPDWTQYNLDVRNEIVTHLPGVNPEAVRKVEVSLYVYTSGGWGSPSAKVFADDFSLITIAGQPYVMLRTVTVNDPPPGGNGNGRFDPAESGDVLTTVKNAGGLTADGVAATLRSYNGLFTITDSTTVFGNMPPGTELTNTADPFKATVSGAVQPGTVVPCTLFVRSDNWGHEWKHGIAFTVGIPPRPPGEIIWGPKVCPGMPTSYGLYGLAYNTQDNLLYCTYFMNSTIYKYSSDSMLTAAGTVTAPQDSCTDIDYCAYDNTFWILANPQRTVYKITPNGTVLRQFAVSAVDYPVGLVEHDAEHKLYITDRRTTLGAQQLVFIYDTLGTLLQTVNHPKNGTYGTRCLALDAGTPSNPPSLLNMYTWFNSGGTAIDSICLYEIDRVGLTVLNSFKFTNTAWNVRGVEYDPRDASYWITIMQDNTGGNNRIFKIAGFNPPVGAKEENPGPHASDPRLTALPNPFRSSVVLRMAYGAGRNASLCIYDNTGRLVRTLPAHGAERMASGVEWDGRNDAGDAVAPGIYFCGVSGDSKAWTKVVLTR